MKRRIASLLHSIQYFTLESQRESTERTSDDYSALIPQPGQEGGGVDGKLSKELGVPGLALFQFLPGTEAQIAISYKASDEMRVTLYFDQDGGFFPFGKYDEIKG